MYNSKSKFFLVGAVGRHDTRAQNTTSHRDQTEQKRAGEMNDAGFKIMGIPFYPFWVRNQIPNGFQIDCAALEGLPGGDLPIMFGLRWQQDPGVLLGFPALDDADIVYPPNEINGGSPHMLS